MHRKAGVLTLPQRELAQYFPIETSHIYVRCKKLTDSPSPHGVEVIQTKSTTVSVHRTLTERLPCISVRPFFLLLHVPPENKMIGSLKWGKLIIITTVLPVKPKRCEHQLYIQHES